MKVINRDHFLSIRLILIIFLAIFFWLVPGAGQADQTGVVVYAVSGSSFNRIGGDPATTRGGGAIWVSHVVFDGLTIEDMNKKDVPAVAKSWKLAPGWEYVDFFLRDDVKFHNGDPVTAEDAKYSLEKYMTRHYKFLFSPVFRRKIKKIEVVNPYHLRVYFNEAYMGFWGQFGLGGGIMPKKYREKVGDKGFAEKPIGCGPFRWVDYKQDQWFEVEAVEKHYRHTPEYKTLKAVYVPEPSTRLAMLRAGEADIATLSSANVPVVKADPDLRLVLSKNLMASVLIFGDLLSDEVKTPFHDIRVRKAASLAIDRKGITEKIFFGVAEPYGEVLSPVTLGYDPSIKPDPYDPEAAKALLAEAGYPNGFETKLCTGTSGKYWAEAVSSNLADIGIKAKLDLYESGAWMENFVTKRLRGLVSHVSYYNALRQGPENMSNFYMEGMPWCYMTTPEISAAVIKGQWSMSDEETAEWGRKISKLIRDSRINIHLWSSHGIYGVGPKIAYYQPKAGSVPSQAYEYIRLKR